MLSDLNNITQTFEPISLGEMENVTLMDRMDTKYVFPSSILPEILQGMSNDYRLLEINSIRNHRYESLYYDTAGLNLYQRHQNGLLNRWKLRFRRYVDSGALTFFEIKFKTNKARTIKRRIKIDSIPERIEGASAEFLKKISPLEPDTVQPSMWVNYSRMTFVNKKVSERLTLDTGLHYILPINGNPGIWFPQMVVAEAKRDKASTVSQFIRLIRNAGIRKGSLSKYCFGIYNLYPNIKKNNFKPRVRFLHKMAGAEPLIYSS